MTPHKDAPYAIILESLITQYAPNFESDFEPENEEWIASTNDYSIAVDFIETIRNPIAGNLKVSIHLKTKDISLSGIQSLHDELMFGEEFLLQQEYVFVKGRAGDSDDNELCVDLYYQIQVDDQEGLKEILSELDGLASMLKKN